MIVEIKGVHFENQGAHLMLLAVMERLRVAMPGAGIVLDGGRNNPGDRIAAIGAFRKLRLRKRWFDLNCLSHAWPDAVNEALARRSLVAEGRLNAVLDASGYAYGGSWTPWLMTYAAAEITRLAARGRPYIFLPQAFGPFSRSRAAAQFGAALYRAALVCVRDRQSQRFLSDLSPRLAQRLELYPDFSIDVAGDPSAARRWGVDGETILLVPNHQMTAARNPDDAWRSGYVDFLASLAILLRKQGRSVLLLNHAGREDARLCARIAGMVGDLRTVEEADPRAVKGVIGAAAAVVCSRFHGCVAALSQGVPCIGTSWSHKYRELFDEFGAGQWLLRECSAPLACELLDETLRDRAAHAQRLAGHSARLMMRVESMWARVFDILRASPSIRPGRD